MLRTTVRLARLIVRGQKPVRFYGVLQVMLESDQETVLRALEDARRILGRCIAGQRNATRAVERLLAVLDEIEVRSGPGCLNRFSASLSEASAGIMLPCGLAAR
jgi:hypothetical protein